MIVNCLLENNVSSYGGAFYLQENSHPELTNLTVVKNTAYYGGAIFCDNNCDPKVTNTVLWDNSGYYGGNQIYLSDIESDPSISYSNIAGGKEAIGGNGSGNNYTSGYDDDTNMKYLPVFASNSVKPYSLTNLSPCINSGKLDITNLSLPAKDLANNNRVYNGDIPRIDIGAYEFVGEPTGSPIVYFEPTKVDFSYRKSGGVYKDTLYIINKGNTTLNINDIIQTNTNESFSVSLFNKAISTTIPPHSKDSLLVTFTPVAGKDSSYSVRMKIKSSEIEGLSIEAAGKGVVGTFIAAGNVSGTWTKANNPYNVAGNITVSGNLNIQDSVNVRFLDNYSLTVPQNAQLSILGKIDSKVKLTVADTTGFDLNPNSSQGGWKGIVFNNTGTDDVLDHCILEYGKKIFKATDVGYNEKNCGGLIYCENSSPVIKNSAIHYGRAYFGGGVYAVKSAIVLQNVSFTENTADKGSALYLQECVKTELFGNLFANNKNSDDVSLVKSSPDFINCTFADNNSKASSIYCANNSSPKIMNSIITPNNNRPNIYLFDDSCDPDIIYSNFSGGKRNIFCYKGYWGNAKNDYTGYYKNNFDLAVNFDNKNKNPYSLKKYSVCNNAANKDTTLFAMPSIDLAGNKRVYQGTLKRLDLGAYETQVEATGDAYILTDRDTLDYGTIKSGYTKKDTLIVYNHGNSKLVTNEIYFSNNDNNTFVVEYFNKENKLEIKPHEIDSIKVVFRPAADLSQQYLNRMIMSTNIGRKEVALQAYGLSGTVIAGGKVSGTWSKKDSPYQITGSVEVDGQLTIEPGTELVFRGYYGLIVKDDAILKADGTKSNPIIFTTSDSLGYYPEYNLSNFGWKGITITNSGNNDTFKHCVFEFGNGKSEQYGINSGGVFTSINSSPDLSDVTFQKNTGAYGAALYAINTSMRIANGMFKDNRSSGQGGAIVFENSTAKIHSSVFANNQTAKTGGAVYLDNSNVEFANVTMFGNKSEFGGAVYIYRSSPLILNSILWGNHATNKGKQIYIADKDNDNIYSYPEIYFSDIQGGILEIGVDQWKSYSGEYYANMNYNPDFKLTSPYAYQLKNSSPCINAGSKNSQQIGLPGNDLAGNLRFFAGRVDIGAYESQDNPSGPAIADYNKDVQNFGYVQDGTVTTDTLSIFNNDYAFSSVCMK